MQKNHKIDKMVKFGLIEDKESKQLKEEINAKIYRLQHSAPKVNMIAQPIDWDDLEELSEVFVK